MAKVLQQICIENHSLVDGDNRLDLVRGEEYTTSYPKDGVVTVFSKFWASGVPQSIFAGGKDLHTGETYNPEPRVEWP